VVTGTRVKERAARRGRIERSGGRRGAGVEAGIEGIIMNFAEPFIRPTCWTTLLVTTI